MENNINRREFLKFIAFASLNLAISKKSVPLISAQRDQTRENVLFVLFDSWSASNISINGYERKTTPVLERLVERAIVYHRHYAGGHYTPPGTTSLLTGNLPWKHRAFNHYPQLDDEWLRKNIFHTFSDYYRFAYSHNPLAHHLLQQFALDIDELKSWEELYFGYDPALLLFKNDHDIASVSWNRAMRFQNTGFASSLILARFNEFIKSMRLEYLSNSFPRGVPNYNEQAFFTIEEGIDYLLNMTQSASQPFLGYYHFYPPHDPYHTRQDFYNFFKKDGYLPPEKPPHYFKDSSKAYIWEQRRWYDEFVLYVDAEFGRLYESLEKNGILENTWIVLTSDHGEMFERGILGHGDPVFYQPIINIPLVIFPPGQMDRVDIYENTRAIDLLPTILSVTDQNIPSWVEGEVVPPFGDRDHKLERDITSVQVEKIVNGKITTASAMCVRNNFKALWCFGYDELNPRDEIVELYDLATDPEEMDDLALVQKDLADELVDVLRSKMDELERAY